MIYIKGTDETTLLTSLKSGDEGALCEIIRLYSDYVGAIVWNIIGCAMTAADAEETASDVFFTMWRNAGKVRPGCLRGYLASIARSKAKNKLREKRIDLYLEDDSLEFPDPQQTLMLSRRELKDILDDALCALSPRDRDIMIRHYYLCQTADDIAGDTGIPRETVRTRLKAGLAALKKQLSKEAAI